MNSCGKPRALIQPESVSPEQLSSLARAIARATALDPRPVRRALLGDRVRDSTRLTVERALRDLQHAPVGSSANAVPPRSRPSASHGSIVDPTARPLTPSEPRTP